MEENKIKKKGLPFNFFRFLFKKHLRLISNHKVGEKKFTFLLISSRHSAYGQKFHWTLY